MTRAEFFVTRRRGHWSKARKAFRCEFVSSTGMRCMHTTEPGSMYLTTDVPKYPASRDPVDSKIMRRYCFHCANGAVTLDQSSCSPDNSNSCK
jgi:hypothetical protein